jgi:hypothetical protein
MSGFELSLYCNFLSRQRNVGSVVTQSHDDEDSDDDEDEPNNEVFGVATVIKLIKDQVRHFLLKIREIAMLKNAIDS